jgi:cold shock CspA family protein
MSSEYVFGRTRKASAKRSGKLARPIERRGVPDSGRIVRLFVGQGHGFIRLANDREIFFHRADVQEGTSINDFHVGDAVVFERLDDSVSGARALCVRRQRRGR